MSKYQPIKFSDGLQLIQLQKEDAKRLFELVDSSREYLGQWLPWVGHTKTVGDSEKFIESTLVSRESDKEYGYGIEYDGQIVGHISLMHLNDGETPEIGYWVAGGYSGKGIATGATAALTNFAKNQLGIKKVILRADINNAASNRVAAKSGYTHHGQQDLKGQMMNVWRIR